MKKTNTLETLMLKENVYGDLFSYVSARRNKDFKTVNFLKTEKGRLVKKFPKKKSKRILKKYFRLFDKYNLKANLLHYYKFPHNFEITEDVIKEIENILK